MPTPPEQPEAHTPFAQPSAVPPSAVPPPRDTALKMSRQPVPLPTILTVFAIAIGLLMVWKLSFVLLMGFAAVLVAIALRMSAKYLSRWLPITPTMGVCLVLALVFLAIVGLAMNAGPQVTQQMRQLIAALPEAWRQVMAWLGNSTLGNLLIDQVSEGGVRR